MFKVSYFHCRVKAQQKIPNLSQAHFTAGMNPGEQMKAKDKKYCFYILNSSKNMHV